MKKLLCLFTFGVLMSVSQVTSAGCEPWEPDTHYTIGDKVIYSGQGYECIVWDVWYWPPTDTRFYQTRTLDIHRFVIAGL